MPTGTYALLLSLDRPVTIEVGGIGERRFEPGAYAYVGSAFGPGGLDARVARHRRLAAGEADVRHWHVDYLLGVARLQSVYTAERAAVECELAADLPGEHVPGFGASDCDCGSHLAFAPEMHTISKGLEHRLEERSGSEAV